MCSIKMPHRQSDNVPSQVYRDRKANESLEKVALKTRGADNSLSKRRWLKIFCVFLKTGLDDLVSTEEVCGDDLLVFCEAVSCLVFMCSRSSLFVVYLFPCLFPLQMTGATPFFAAAFVGGLFIVVGVVSMSGFYLVNLIVIRFDFGTAETRFSVVQKSGQSHAKFRLY